MNKITLIALVYILSFNFASTQVLPTSNNSEQITVEPHYTTVQNLYSLESGMSYDEVRSLLNAKPFNILNNLSGSGMIIEYKYMHKGKKIRKDSDTYYMSTVNSGNTHYHDAHSAYLLFDNNRALKSYYTDAGTELSEDVLTWENTLKKIVADPDHCENCGINSPGTKKNCGADCKKACCQSKWTTDGKDEPRIEKPCPFYCKPGGLWPKKWRKTWKACEPCRN